MERICAYHSGAIPPLGEHRMGHVHSVYRRAVNLALEDGSLVTVSPLADGRGPCCLHVEGCAAPPGHVPGEQVLLTRTVLRIGAWQAEISPDGGYELPRGVLHVAPDRCGEVATYLAYRLEAERVRVDQNPIWAAAQMWIQRWCHVLEERFACNDRWGIVAAGRELLGLGQGLTPSGDDVLTGLFALLGMEGSPVMGADRLLGRIIQGQREQTTDVSWQMLCAAAQGQYKQVLIDCAQVLGTEGRNPADCVKRVLSIGHSSGRDMLQGCMTALRILQHYSNKI